MKPAVRFLHRTTACASLLALIAGCSGGEGERERGGGSLNLTVVYSSDLLGRIRSCGCTVEDQGGLARRATYIENTMRSYGEALILEVGDVMSLDLSYSKKEAQLTFEAFDLMHIDAFTPGEIEFIFGLPYLTELVSNAGFDVVAANLVDPATGEPIFGMQYKIREMDSGLKVGITGILDDSIRFPGYIDRSEFALLPAEETLEGLLPAMKRESDYQILLSHVGLDRSIRLAERFPDFELVVAGHGKPVTKKLTKVGETLVVANGGQGQYVGRLDLTVSAQGRNLIANLALVPLKEEIPMHDGVVALFRKHGLALTDKELEGH